MWRVIAAIIETVLGALFAALRIRRLDGERDAAIKERAVNEAALETVEVVNETADARADVPASPVDPDDLARELRTERLAARTGHRRRPF